MAWSLTVRNKAEQFISNKFLVNFNEVAKNSQPATIEYHRTYLSNFHLVWMALTGHSATNVNVSRVNLTECRMDTQRSNINLDS